MTKVEKALVFLLSVIFYHKKNGRGSRMKTDN